VSTSELARQIQAIESASGAGPAVAFFDLDRTLIAGYSILAMAWERAQLGMSRGELRQSIGILHGIIKQRGENGGKKGNSYQRLVRQLSRSLTGVSEDTLTRLGEQAYRNSIARSLYRESISLVEAHRAAGHKLVIVSAASRYQVEPIARALRIDEICCTQLEVIDGQFTGKTIAPLCFGEGKAMAARRVCRNEGVALKDSWFYSDSSDDLPLLRKVGHPVAVNPSEALATHARAEGWPQLRFESRGLPSVETLLRTLLTAQTVMATAAICAIGKQLRVGRITNANRMTRLLGEIGCGFAGIDIETEGAHHLKQERPAVFIFNHQSLLDSMVISHLLREDVVALVKKEMANNPVVGPLLRQIDTIFVDRDDRDQSAVLKQSLAVLKSGRSLVIAPEGSRSTLGHIQPFKHGAFYMAKKAGVPLIPIVLHNVKDALPNGGIFIRATTVRVTVLPPMHPGQMGGVRQACERMEQQYAEVLGNSTIAALPRHLTTTTVQHSSQG
jgi:putative phosphoserine phosphatase/1-acylglycerol-3-phosphate O-acyltransferase